MSPHKPFMLAIIGGFTMVLVGFFLPWGPSGPTNLRWGVKMTNEAGSEASLGGGAVLADGEALEAGPAGTVKITSAQGRTRVVAGTYSGRGAIWQLGYAALLLGVCGVAVGVFVLLRPQSVRVPRILLLALSSLGLAVIICRVVRMLFVGYSLSDLGSYFAPFGRLQCSAGYILAMIGFVVALCASALLVRQRPSDVC